MPKLEWSTALGRLTRTEPLSEQGIITWDLVRDAIRQGKSEEAIQWLRYIRDGENYVTPESPGFLYTIEGQLTYIAKHFGEGHLEKVLREWQRKFIDAGADPTYCLSPLERLQYHAELERADYSGPKGKGFEIIEEADRYVMVLDPCGSCGRMRREEAKGGPPLGKTRKGYPWSWGKANVPYFCVRDCLWWELMAIEDIGYPVKIYEWSEDPQRPCKVFFYKKPELIPDVYFTRLGMKKDTTQFRRKVK